MPENELEPPDSQVSTHPEPELEASEATRRSPKISRDRPPSGATTVELPPEVLPSEGADGRPSREQTLVDALPGGSHNGHEAPDDVFEEEPDEAPDDVFEEEPDEAPAPHFARLRQDVSADGWDDPPEGDGSDSTVRRELSRLEEALGEAQHRLLESHTAAADTRRKLNEIRAQLETVTAERDRLAEQARVADEERDDDRAALSELRAELEAERTAHEVSRREARANAGDLSALDGLRAQVAALEAQRSESSRGDAGRRELERSLGQALEERNSLTRALKRLERHHLNVRARLAIWLEEVLETMADRDGLEADAQSARSSLQRARDYCESVDLALNVVGSELEGARGGFSSALLELAATERQTQSYQSRAATFAETVATARSRISAVTAALAELADGLEGLGGTLASEEGERREIGAAVGSAFGRLQSHDNGLAQLAERLQSQRNALTGLAGELDAATEADELLQGEVARRDAAFRDHLERIDEVEHLLDEAETLITRVFVDDGGGDGERDGDGNRDGDHDGDRDGDGERAATVVVEAEPEPHEGRSTPPGWVSAVPPVGEKDDRTVVSTLQGMPAFDRVAFQRLHDGSLRASERLAPLHLARPSIESARLSQSMEISTKAAFLVSCIDGTVTLGDLIDLSGLQHEEAAEILIGLLLDGHIRIQERPGPRP